MKKHIPRAAWIILALYLVATLVLLVFGYAVEKPAVRMQEFPFSITYICRGRQSTISEVYVAEQTDFAKYMGDEKLQWYGYIKDRNRLEPDFIRIDGDDTHAFFIELNLEPGWLMGDPAYADSTCAPIGVAIRLADGQRITDPEKLEELGLRVDSWEYPQPIENRFSFGGFSLSSEAVLFTSAIAIAALLLCLIFVERDREQTATVRNKIGVVLNLLIVILAFPFILIFSAISEILGDTSWLQQLLYLAPALTVTGVSASVVLRRRGYELPGLLIQFVGPVLFLLAVLIGAY